VSGFDISLPALYDYDWRKAYIAENGFSPRFSTYQPPGGDPVMFIYKSVRFRGGQAVDTAEYPFDGLWSNETLNKKPQTLDVQGFLRGKYYPEERGALLSALFVSTSDETPGYLDLPLWGRFPVVVVTYSIEESAVEGGQCAVSLTLTRAGIPAGERARVLSPADFTRPEETAAVVVEKFGKLKLDGPTLAQIMGQLTGKLLSVLGRVQGLKNELAGIANMINGITNLIAQGIKSPMELSQALLNAVSSIVAGVMSIESAWNEVSSYFSAGSDNKKSAALMFLSAASFTADSVAANVAQAETKRATENLYRSLSLCAAAEILTGMEELNYREAEAYTALYQNLESSVDLEDSEVYAAVAGMRRALTEALRNSRINTELKKNIARPAPLVYLSHYLGCDSGTLRRMNTIEDSFNVSGEIAYV
jgi:prophage DNA circulation protein